MSVSQESLKKFAKLKLFKEVKLIGTVEGVKQGRCDIISQNQKIEKASKKALNPKRTIEYLSILCDIISIYLSIALRLTTTTY